MTHLIEIHFDHPRYDFDCLVHIRRSTSIAFYYFDSPFCYKICSDLKYFPRRMLVFGRHFFPMKMWSSTCFVLNPPGTPAEEYHKIILISKLGKNLNNQIREMRKHVQKIRLQCASSCFLKLNRINSELIKSLII